jgi:hypothetical protein
MMHPFQNTWPYETVMGDIYVSRCPFCDAENVLLPLKPSELQVIAEGKKKRLVFPCCRNVLTIIDTDRDYLLSDIALRNNKA